MIDLKSQNDSESPLPEAEAETSSDRKLSIELPSSRQIYTTGSVVSGLVHLGTKEHGSGARAIEEVRVSLVCAVHTRCAYL